MDPPPRRNHESEPPESDEIQAGLRCARCGHEMATRVMAVAVVDIMPDPATKRSEVESSEQLDGVEKAGVREPTMLEIMKFFWDAKQRPTWRDYMIAGDQTIRLI